MAEKMTMRAAALKALDEAGTPLHVSEVYTAIMDAGLIKTKGKTPEATLGAILAVDAKAKEGTFVRTAPGTFGLRGRGDRKMRRRPTADKGPGKGKGKGKRASSAKAEPDATSSATPTPAAA